MDDALAQRAARHDFPNGDAYADAVLDWETNGIMEQAIVAVELGIPHPFAADARELQAGKLARPEFYKRVHAQLGQAMVTTTDGRQVPARQGYREKYESAKK